MRVGERVRFAMVAVPSDKIPTLASLRAKNERLADGLSTDAATRVRRALSWLERAQMETDDADAAFIFYWIAFSAASAESQRGHKLRLNGFFKKVVAADKSGVIRRHVSDGIDGAILDLSANPYVFKPFWDRYNGVSDSADEWQNVLIDDVERVSRQIEAGKVADALAAAFERLRVVRSQLFHGDATWNRGVNRSQIEDGVEILSFIVPAVINLMLDAPDMFDHPSPYPSVESDTAQVVEDIHDYSLAANVMRRVRLGLEPVYSSAEVRKDLDLDD